MYCTFIVSVAYGPFDLITCRPNGTSKSEVYNVNCNGHLVCLCNCLDVGKEHKLVKLMEVNYYKGK